MKKKLLIFPCGSEVALEIHRSLRYSNHFEMVGASSVDDHGKFVFENYLGGIPLHSHPEFIAAIRNIVVNEKIDAIFPAMDAVANTLKPNESILGCKVIGSSQETVAICSSKAATYNHFNKIIPCPNWTSDLSAVKRYPVFIKPDDGYGSRNVYLAKNQERVKSFLEDHKDISFIFCDYLPGREYTIDCFSDYKGELLFYGIRQRVRVSNGISVNTVQTSIHECFFNKVALVINKNLHLRGAWFFQMKENKDGNPVLLEVAARLAGSSSYFRAKGVNLALMSAFDAFDVEVSININDYNVELDRALGCRYKLDLTYEKAYIDLDDCLILGNRVNAELIKYIFQARNKGIQLALISRHKNDINQTLNEYKLTSVFDEIIHIQDERPKSDFIDNSQAIFIDDSHAERVEVKKSHGIPVFSPDMVEMLMD